MSEKEYRLDVCPECKVREEDSSKKKLYQCQLCERWFCEKHLEPKLAVFRDLESIIKDPVWREEVEKDWGRDDGHPDYEYTKERFDELKVEEEKIRKEIEDFLNKSKAYRKIIPRKQIPEEIRYPATEKRPICPSCGSERAMTTAYREEFEAFECLDCHSTWKSSWNKDKTGLYQESKIKRTYHLPQISFGKAFCLVVMGIVAFAYIPSLEWALSLNLGSGILSYIPVAFVLAMSHELLHALAWWYFGYSAIPIPILIPPILGITIGEKPRRKRENFVISLAPILLTITSYLIYQQTGNERYLMFGMINLLGMGYDMFSAIFR